MSNIGQTQQDGMLLPFNKLFYFHQNTSHLFIALGNFLLSCFHINPDQHFNKSNLSHMVSFSEI